MKISKEFNSSIDIDNYLVWTNNSVRDLALFSNFGPDFGVSWIGVIFPSLLQLQRGITDIEDRKQKELCAAKFQKYDEMSKGKLSEIDMEREEECGICLELNTKVVLPDCNHSLCLKCYTNWWVTSSHLYTWIMNRYVHKYSADAQ